MFLKYLLKFLTMASNTRTSRTQINYFESELTEDEHAYGTDDDECVIEQLFQDDVDPPRKKRKLTPFQKLFADVPTNNINIPELYQLHIPHNPLDFIHEDPEV